MRWQRMTLYQTLSGASLVFCALQDDRLHAVADEFPDRPRLARRHPAGYAALRRLAASLRSSALVLLAICGFSPLGNLLLYPLESRFPPWDAARGAPDGIIVLGASIEADLSAAHGTPVVRSAPDRIIAAAALALPLSERARRLLRRQCESDFERCQGSRFRRRHLRKPRRRQIAADHGTAFAQHAGECRILARRWSRRKQGERWLLVTSAFHMPRSVGLFRKAGFAGRAVSGRLAGRRARRSLHVYDAGR